jgi:predicted transcriptional regulator
MEHEPGIFEQRDLEAEAASIARARADIAAGRVHSHAVVKEWLLTWGTSERRPFREWLAARNG